MCNYILFRDHYIYVLFSRLSMLLTVYEGNVICVRFNNKAWGQYNAVLNLKSLNKSELRRCCIKQMINLFLNNLSSPMLCSNFSLIFYICIMEMLWSFCLYRAVNVKKGFYLLLDSITPGTILLSIL